MKTKNINTTSAAYDQAAHIRELEAAGVPTRLFTAQSGDELLKIIHAEVTLMEADPLTEDGRRLLKYWLDNAPTVCGKSPGATLAELYRGLYSGDKWRHEYGTLILSALHDVLTGLVKHDAGMQAAVKRLLPAGGERVCFDQPEGSLTWWQVKLNRLWNEGYSVGARFDNERVPDADRTADYLFSLVNTPAVTSPTPNSKDGWTVGKLSVIKWGASLKYQIDDVMETFTIKNSPLRWKDIELLMNADGDFVKMPKGFPQRWNKGNCHRLKVAAFEAEEKSPKGKGRYRLHK